MSNSETRELAHEVSKGSFRLARVSDEFIAFIYAAGVGVFLDKSYDGKLFNIPLLTICVVVGIFFFAQDWLSRFGGFRRIEGITLPTFYVKSILDVAVVISLSLIILDAIELMSVTKPLLPTPAAATSFFVKVSVFAAVAWLWNFLIVSSVVAVDPVISNRDILSFLFTGHISDEILDLFPKVQTRLAAMETWIADCISKIKVNKEQLEEERGLIKHFVNLLVVITRIGWRYTVVGPFSQSLLLITFTCWIGLHILILNLLLGLLIFLSAMNGGVPLMPTNWIPSTWWQVFLMGLVLLFLFWLSSFYRAAFFLGGRKRRRRETLGHFIFFVFLLVFYSLWSAQHLVWILAIQQLAANLFIFNFLLIPAKKQQEIHSPPLSEA